MQQHTSSLTPPRADPSLSLSCRSRSLSILAKAGAASRDSHANIFAGRYETEGIPKHELPQDGLSEEASYHLLNNELELDGKPALNLASFVHTSLPEWGERLVKDHQYVNIVDQDEYPQTLAIHGRCISQLAALWHAPKEKVRERSDEATRIGCIRALTSRDRTRRTPTANGSKPSAQPLPAHPRPSCWAVSQ